MTTTPPETPASGATGGSSFGGRLSAHRTGAGEWTLSGPDHEAGQAGSASASEEAALMAHLQVLLGPDLSVIDARRTASGQTQVRVRLTSGHPEPTGQTAYLLSVADPKQAGSAATTFVFSLDGPGDDDALVEVEAGPSAPFPIDYMAKDFESFRATILNHLMRVLTNWAPGHAADVGVTLVEILAYAADYLSYYQDAIATEAYLHTALQRGSVTRHAALLDYAMSEGCNARAFVVADVLADEVALPRGTQLTTAVPGRGLEVPVEDAVQAGATFFETMTPAQFSKALNTVRIFALGDGAYTVPEGATSLALRGHVRLDSHALVAFEQVKRASGAPHALRQQVVRLAARPVHEHDPLSGEPVTLIRWHAADALSEPFPLQEVTPGGGVVRDMTLVRGNVVLADHGRTVRGSAVVPIGTDSAAIDRLTGEAITYAMPLPALDGTAGAARYALVQDPSLAAAQVAVHETLPSVEMPLDDDGALQLSISTRQIWTTTPPLTLVNEAQPHITVSRAWNGNALVHFQSGNTPTLPLPEYRLTATYRTGNGLAGNIGPSTLRHVAVPDPGAAGSTGITSVRNFGPAVGGREPEPIESAKATASSSYRRMVRCVIPEDYERALMTHDAVLRARAVPSVVDGQHRMDLYIEPAGGPTLNEEVRAELAAFIEPMALLGYEIRILPVTWVPMAVRVQAMPAAGVGTAVVRDALRTAFFGGPGQLVGFFSPEAWTFGQGVYASEVLAVAQSVPGVASVQLGDFQRTDGTDGANRVPRVETAIIAAANEILTFSASLHARVDLEVSRPHPGGAR